MKILIINTHDITGGAARGAYRLQECLLEAGIETTMLVRHKKSKDKNIKEIQFVSHRFLNKLIRYVRIRLEHVLLKFYKYNFKEYLFNTSHLPFHPIIKEIKAIKPDIVHFHWICFDTIPIEDYKKINVPIVWSLHDMWAFTGGCHYDKECGKYKNECGKCPALKSQKENDFSRWVWKRKKNIYSQIKNLTIIGLSKWMTECAEKSSVLQSPNIKIMNLPNPTNTKIFKPSDKKQERKKLGLPLDKKLICFGAMGSTSDPRKGFLKLKEALEKINSEEIELVVFGAKEEIPLLNMKILSFTEYITDEKLISLYNAVDVMVVPSLQENLALTIVESLSCGTPVVAFHIGGNSDMIEHKHNGYLAKPFDTQDLADGIQWIINNPEYEKLSQNAREKVVQEFDYPIVAQKYKKLYQQILHNKNSF